MEDEDEDVIFENSVLHQVLISSGFTDIETEPKFVSVENCSKSKDEADGCSESQALKPSYKENIFHNLSFSPFIRFLVSDDVIYVLYRQQQFLTFKHLVNSQLLSEDDRSFLQYLIEDSECPQITSVELYGRWTRTTIGFLILCVLIINALAVPWNLPTPFLMIPHLSLLNCSFHHMLSTVFFNALIGLVLFISLALIKYRIRIKILKDLREKDEAIKSLESQAWELMYIEKKCLRLLRETELVARGFTLATNHRVASSSHHALSVGMTPQWCEQFRQTLLVENVTLMSELKKCVVEMMKRFSFTCRDSDYSSLESMTVDPVNGPSDQMKSGIEIAGKRGIGQDYQEKICSTSNTELLPLAKLNKSIDLLNVYISGFIRRLALCFYVQNHKDQSVEPFTATAECVQFSAEAIQKTTANLNRQYKFRRALHRRSSGQTELKMEVKRDETVDLYDCIRSLEAHLENTLEKTRILKDLLESRVDQTMRRHVGLETGDAEEFMTIHQEDKAAWRVILKQVKTTLDSCRDSCDMTLRHLDKQSNQVSVETSQQQKEVPKPARQEPVIRYIVAQENVIVDQVFEAVTTGNEVDDRKEKIAQYSTGDQAKALADRETIKMFSQELHSVVKQRAITQQAREEIALARTRASAGQEMDGGRFPLLISMLMADDDPEDSGLKILPQLGRMEDEKPLDLSKKLSDLSLNSGTDIGLAESSPSSSPQLVTSSSGGLKVDPSTMTHPPQRKERRCTNHEPQRSDDDSKLFSKAFDSGDSQPSMQSSDLGIVFEMGNISVSESGEAMSGVDSVIKKPKPMPRKHNASNLTSPLKDFKIDDRDYLMRPIVGASSNSHLDENFARSSPDSTLSVLSPRKSPKDIMASASVIVSAKRTPTKRNKATADIGSSFDDSESARGLLFEPAPKIFHREAASDPVHVNMLPMPQENLEPQRECFVQSHDLSYAFTKNVAQLAAIAGRARQLPDREEETFGDAESDEESL